VTYGIVQCGPDYPDGIPYIRPVDMTDEGGVQVDALQRTTPEIAAAYARSTVRPGDIVASIGPSFGKVMIVPSDLDGANLTQGTARVAPGRDVFARFLFWALRSDSSRMAWDSFCSGATFRALTLQILETCDVALPASAEQRAIAAFLDRETARIDALVAKKERLIALLQEKRTALITRAVTKGLDPTVPMKDSGVEWLGEIPAHWEVKPLRWVLSVRSGEALSNSEFELTQEEGLEVAVIGGNGVMGYTNRENTASACIAIGRVGALCGNVHMVEPPAWVTDNALVVSDIIGFDRRYLALLLRVLDLNRWASQNAQPLITGGFLKGQRVCAPPDTEQRAIGAFLDGETSRIDALVSKVREAIERLKELRTALISAAVTGKIDVREEGA
jgi:type I restriction enzyme S subunit